MGRGQLLENAGERCAGDQEVARVSPDHVGPDRAARPAPAAAIVSDEYVLRGILSLTGATDADNGRNAGRGAATARFRDRVAIAVRVAGGLDDFRTA